jgi:hypothetical protein
LGFYIKKMKKFTLLVLCLAITVSAQEQQEEHKNFTVGQRFGTWGINLVAPGLGSHIIMQDNVGTGIHLGLFGAGAIFMISSQNYHSKDDWDFGAVGLFLWGISFWSVDVVFNIVRSATYDNQKYIQQLSENPSYKNFTIGQRFGTLGLNAIPGLGSIVIMNDWAGAITQWVLTGSTAALIANDDLEFWPVLIGIDVVFNIYRSFTYNKPGNVALGKSDGLHLSVFQNGHGRVMPHLLFVKVF